MISYPDELPTTNKSSNTKKKLIEIRKFLSQSISLTFSTALIPVLPDFDSAFHQQGVKEKYEWLESAYDDKTSYWVPSAKHHAGKHRSVALLLNTSAILPPVYEPVHTLDTQYNCMNIISNTIITLNPGQIPVDTADQPIFIRFPDKFGLDKYFCLFGSLLTEKLLLIICGQAIKGNGFDEVMCTCVLSIVGTDSLMTVNGIKRAMYCLQVLACLIYSKLKQAHMDSGSDELILLWLANKTKINEMCFYWKLILKLMIDLLVFIRSL